LKPLNVIIFGQVKSDNINQLISMTIYFLLLKNTSEIRSQSVAFNICLYYISIFYCTKLLKVFLHGCFFQKKQKDVLCPVQVSTATCIWQDPKLTSLLRHPGPRLPKNGTLLRPHAHSVARSVDDIFEDIIITL